MFPSQATLPALQQDLIGSQQAYYPNRVPGIVFGTNTNVNNVRVDLWNGPTGTYVFPVVAQQMRVVSSNANDTANGTGVQQIHIHYLDDQYNVQAEIVTLNGTTPVLTQATNILRVNGFHAIRWGSGGTSAGNISLTNTGGTVTYSYIVAAFNTARQAIFTVPSGNVGYISRWRASSSSAAGTHYCQIDLRTNSHAGILYPGGFLAVDSLESQNSGLEMTFSQPVQVPPKTDVKISAISDGAAAAAVCSGSVVGWYEPAI